MAVQSVPPYLLPEKGSQTFFGYCLDHGGKGIAALALSIIFFPVYVGAEIWRYSHRTTDEKWRDHFSQNSSAADRIIPFLISLLEGKFKDQWFVSDELLAKKTNISGKGISRESGKSEIIEDLERVILSNPNISQDDWVKHATERASCIEIAILLKKILGCLPDGSLSQATIEKLKDHFSYR